MAQILLPAEFQEEHRQIVLTYLVLLEEIVNTLPDAARIVHQGLRLTVIDYELWKSKLTHYQATR